MGKPKAPAAPDPAKTAGAQTANNIGTAIAQQTLNNTNQVTPYGNLTYQQSGQTEWTDPNTGAIHQIPQFTATTSLSPDEQYKLNQGNVAEKNLADVAVDRSGFLKGHFQKGVNPQNLPDRGGVPEQAELGRVGAQDYGAQRKRVEGALMARLNPQIERDREAMRTRLINQGITLGSDAYSAASDDFGRNVNDARLGAILGAGQEQNRLAELEAMNTGFNNSAAMQEFSMGSDRFNMANANRAGALQEELALRNQPINEITALLSGSQVSNPNFVSTTPAQMANVDRAGLEMEKYRGDLANWQQNNNTRNRFIGGLFGLGSAGIMASDIRVKENVQRIGTRNDGLGVYLFDYIDGAKGQIGVMAQEVEPLYPDAVLEFGGIKHVDYGALP